MKETDILTLQAFMSTLSQLKTLDESLQMQINQLAQDFANDQSLAVDNLRKLIRQHENIKIPYQKARNALQSLYQAKPRNKVIPPSGEPEPEDENLEVENFTRPFNWLEITHRILSAHDIVKTTNQFKSEIEALPLQPQEKPQITDLNKQDEYKQYYWIQRLFG